MQQVTKMCVMHVVQKAILLMPQFERINAQQMTLITLFKFIVYHFLPTQKFPSKSLAKKPFFLHIDR